MKSKFLVVILGMFLVGGGIVVFYQSRQSERLLNPDFILESTSQTRPSATPTPTPTLVPLDRSTDLQSELDKVDPLVDSSNFKLLEEVLLTF